MKHSKMVKQRVLILALSVILIQTQLITVFGYEIDDLREFDGRQRIGTEENIEIQENIIKAYDVHKVQKEESDTLNYASIAESISKKRNELNIERDELLKNMHEDMAMNNAADSIIILADKIHKIDIKLQGNDMKIPEVIGDNAELESQYQIANEILKTANDKFELGDIGDRLKSPIKDLFKVYYPFGDMLNPYNSNEVWHNNGVYFDLPKYGSDIRVQWNGTVKKIVKEDVTWGNYIVVQHGNNLETSYSYLDKIDVIEGQELKQYNTIGHASGEYMYFEAILDGTFINPLKLYGSIGVNEYNSWNNSNPGLLVNYDNMYDVKNFIKN